ncbi:hypothetical protein, partial [Sphingobacterium haloxyli]
FFKKAKNIFLFSPLSPAQGPEGPPYSLAEWCKGRDSGHKTQAQTPFFRPEGPKTLENCTIVFENPPPRTAQGRNEGSPARISYA